MPSRLEPNCKIRVNPDVAIVPNINRRWASLLVLDSATYRGIPYFCWASTTVSAVK